MKIIWQIRKLITTTLIFCKTHGSHFWESFSPFFKEPWIQPFWQIRQIRTTTSKKMLNFLVQKGLFFFKNAKLRTTTLAWLLNFKNHTQRYYNTVTVDWKVGSNNGLSELCSCPQLKRPSTWTSWPQLHDWSAMTAFIQSWPRSDRDWPMTQQLLWEYALFTFNQLIN